MTDLLPKDWIVIEFSKIFGKLQYGLTAKASFNAAGVRFLRITDINDNTVDWASVPSCIEPDDDVTRYVLAEGDFVFARSGSIEKAARLSAVPTAVFASYLIRGRPRDNTLSDWLELFLRSNQYLSQIKAAAAGIGMSNVNAQKLGLVRVPVPPEPERGRLVSKLDGLLSRSKAAHTELDRIPILTAFYKSALLASAFRGDLTATWRKATSAEGDAEEFRRLRAIEAATRRSANALGRDERSALIERDHELVDALDRINEDSRIPGTWSWCGLGEVFGVYVGATPSRKNISYWNGDIPWVSSGEVAFCRINATTELISKTGIENTSTRVHPSGTVLLGLIGEGKTRGQAAILDIEACNNQNCAAIRVSEAKYPPEYVYWYLYSVYEQTRNAGAGNNQPALNKDRVQRLPIPLAPPAEAAQIVLAIEARLDPLRRLESEASSARKLLERLDQAILEKAFCGKLVGHQQLAPVE